MKQDVKHTNKTKLSRYGSSDNIKLSIETNEIENNYKDYTISPIRRQKQWYMNMILINFVEFAAESSRGIVLPTLFLYTSSLGGDLAYMGLLTSIFSVGRLISSTVFGWMCDRFSFKTVYIVSSTICLIGNTLYLLADEHVIKSRHLLAFSRFIVGFGAGNRSVCRANVAAVTSINQRLKYITILAMVVFLGYALTPGLGSLVANCDFYIAFIHINKFTAPGTILIGLNILTIIFMIGCFDESIGREDGPLDTKESNNNNTLNQLTHVSEKLVKYGVVVFMFLNFIARGILSIFETINIPLFLQVTKRDMESKEAVVEASNFQFYLGCFGLVTYLCIELFRHIITDVNWLLLGFIATGFGNILFVFYPNNIDFARLSVGEFFIWSVGCPLTTAVAVAAFSKILGGRPQGTLMGLLGSSASVSRIVLPLLPAVLPSMTPLFIINIMFCIVSCFSLKWYDHVVKSSLELNDSKPILRDDTNEGQNDSANSPPRSELHVQP